MTAHQKNNSRPVIAVLVSNTLLFSLPNQKIRPRIQLLVEANNELKNILYYFSFREVDLKERKISGYYWNKSYQRWFRQDFSLPDILFIRGAIEQRYNQTFLELCNIVKKNNGQVINHQRFNKWHLHLILHKDPAIRNYLPLTRAVERPEDIVKMLQRYRVVYLKSHLGSKGEKVLRVEFLPDGSYRCSNFKHEQLTVKNVSSFTTLLETINRFFNGTKFLIQQAIQLIEYENRLIDMRAELQRNGAGNLEIVGISVRQGRLGSPVTTHGNAFKFEDFFIKKMGYSKEKMEALRLTVHQFLRNVYEYIENNYGEYVEIGIDFALDTNEKIWFIEANSKSTKVSLDKAYGKEALFRNYKNILEYSRYLLNQPAKVL